MKIVTVEAAETTLPELLAQVAAGEEIVLARGETPVAKLSPYSAPPRERKFGAFKGEIDAGPEFFEPLPEEELKAWK